MRNRILSFLMIFAVVLCILPGCTLIPNPFGSESGSALQSGNEACDRLIADTEKFISDAELQYDVGNTFAADYLYGLAQAEISSLRLCIDTVMWLKGEGANLAEVIGNAPYKTWDDILGAGLGSDAPAYFESLIHTFRGETEKAADLTGKAEKNPVRKDRDFYFLRRLSVEELKKLKQTVAAEEERVAELYSPRSKLLSARTYAEFSPHYHLAMAQEKEASGDLLLASQSALNALLTDPASPPLYAAAAAYALQSGNAELAYEVLNEGLRQFPEDASVLYIAAMYSYSAGDKQTASEYAEAAKKDADEALRAKIDALLERIGGD